MNKHLIWLVAPTSLVVAAACAPQAPIEPAVQAQVAASYARSLLYRTSTGAGFAGGRGSTIARLAATLEGVTAELGEALPSPVPSPLAGVLRDSDFVKKLVESQPGAPTLQNTLDDLAVQLERWVKERLLAQENLESKTDDAAVYRLKPDPTCRPLAAPGAPLPAIDDDCKQQLEAVELRVLMKALLDGVNLRFVVGPDRREFSNVTLRLDGLEWKADLAESGQAAEVLARALADGAAPSTKWKKLAGKFVLTVQKDATAGVAVSATITEGIEIVRAGNGEAARSSLAIAASTTPVFTLSGNGADKTIVAQLVLGSLDVGTPWDPKQVGAENVDLTSSLAGLSIKARVDETQKRLELPEITVGSYVEKVRGDETFRLSIAPATMGKIAASIDVGTDGVPTVSMGGPLEVTAKYDLAKLASELTGAAPADTIKLAFGDGTNGARARLLSRKGQFAGVEIVSGTMTLGTDAQPAAISVATGKCLTRALSPASTVPAVLASLTVVDCPAPSTSTNTGAK